jgi:hypothetical protein
MLYLQGLLPPVLVSSPSVQSNNIGNEDNNVLFIGELNTGDTGAVVSAGLFKIKLRPAGDHPL